MCTNIQGKENEGDIKAEHFEHTGQKNQKLNVPTAKCIAYLTQVAGTFHVNIQQHKYSCMLLLGEKQK